MERRMISAFFVDEALDCVRRRGLNPAPLLEAAGMPVMVDGPVSAERYGALWLGIAAAIDDEFLGLGGRPMPLGSFTMLCHCVLRAGTLERAMRRALRFLRVVLGDPWGELVVADGLAQIHLRDAGPARSAFTYRTFWIILHGIMCWLVGRRIPLRLVDFRCQEPRRGADYGLFFGAPVRFGLPASRLAFDESFLRLPADRTERGMKQFLRAAPANLLVRYRYDAGLVANIRTRLRQQPPSSWPSFAVLARQMRMPESTLRHRLHQEGQAYRAIKDDIRRGLAIDGLLQGDRSVGEIAIDLGFGEPSAFHRAFRKWTSKSPAAFRREFGRPASKG